MSMSSYRPGCIADLLGGHKDSGSGHAEKDKEVNDLFSKPSKSILKAQKLYQKQKIKSEKKHNVTDATKQENGTKKRKIIHEEPTALPDIPMLSESRSDNKIEKPVKNHPDRKDMRKKAKKRKALNQEQDARTVFVGNLPTTVNKKIVKKMFKKFGVLESIRFRSAAPSNPKMPKKGVVAKKDFHKRMPILNAYVVFTDIEAAKKAEELNGEELEDHHIRVDYLGRDTTKHKHSSSIFVGNLPFGIDDDAVLEHFKQCGDVESVRIVRDKFTRIGKGFGYVLFKEKDSVLLALKLDQEKLKNRKLRVQRSSANVPKASQSVVSKGNMNSAAKQLSPGKRKRDASSGDHTGSTEKTAKKMKKDKQAENFSGSRSKTSSKLTHKKKLKKRLERKKKQKMASLLLGDKKGKVSSKVKVKSHKGAKSSQEKIKKNKAMSKGKLSPKIKGKSHKRDGHKYGKSKQRNSS